MNKTCINSAQEGFFSPDLLGLNILIGVWNIHHENECLCMCGLHCGWYLKLIFSVAPVELARIWLSHASKPHLLGFDSNTMYFVNHNLKNANGQANVCNDNILWGVFARSKLSQNYIQHIMTSYVQSLKTLHYDFTDVLVEKQDQKQIWRNFCFSILFKKILCHNSVYDATQSDEYNAKQEVK